MAKIFILYDGRAKGGDTNRASVLIVANSEAEARYDAAGYKGHDAVWFEYDIKGKTLINERMRPDLPPYIAAGMAEEMREQYFGTPEEDTGITANSDFQPEGVRLKKIRQ